MRKSLRGRRFARGPAFRYTEGTVDRQDTEIKTFPESELPKISRRRRRSSFPPIVGILLAAAVIGGVVLFMVRRQGEPAGGDAGVPRDGSALRTQTPSPPPIPPPGAATGPSLKTGGQKPGNFFLFAEVILESPGFAVVHADENGKPGAIIGQSDLLPPGVTVSVAVPLTRAVGANEKLHGMLHEDTDKDEKFNAQTDAPLKSASGTIVTSPFTVGAE